YDKRTNLNSSLHTYQYFFEVSYYLSPAPFLFYRATYSELQDVLKQERTTLSEFIHSAFISKLESYNKSINA
ncbi:MAG: hypothetical protein ACRD8Z_24055, partial [Nitrososphaeraceae archaeon]